MVLAHGLFIMRYQCSMNTPVAYVHVYDQRTQTILPFRKLPQIQELAKSNLFSFGGPVLSIRFSVAEFASACFMTHGHANES